VVIKRETPTSSTSSATVKKSIKTIRLKHAVQINNKTSEAMRSEKVNGKQRRCENDLTTLKAEDTQLSIDRGGQSDI
jgi:hypothetical protein